MTIRHLRADTYNQRALLPRAAASRGRLGNEPQLFDGHTHMGLDDPAGLLATGQASFGNPTPATTKRAP